MDTWVITDPKAEVFYGTVEAGSIIHAVTLADGGRGRWFADERPAESTQLSAHPAVTLADGRWREVAPVGAQPHGTCGGDVQVTEAYGRRFMQVLPDGTWAVVTYSWYGIAEGVEVTGDTVAQVVEQQIEYLILADPYDLDRNEWWADDFEKNYDPEPTTAGVRKWAEQFTAADIEWDGRVGSR